MKALIAFPPSLPRASRAEQQRRETNDESPRALLFEETLNAEVLDSDYMQSLPWYLRRLYKLLPATMALAIEAYRTRHRYDVVVSWDDRFAVIYALLLLLTRSRSRHVAILSWMAPVRKGSVLKAVHKGIDRIIVYSQDHRDLLIEFFGIPSSKIIEVPYFVDQKFWHPLNLDIEEYICSAGDSKRDYTTLVEAVRGLPINCSIVTRVGKTHQGSLDWVETSKSLAAASEIPDNIVIGPASPAELRSMYARSRFVVIPLISGFRDIGFTSLAEAMAMGKAVICTHTYGLTEFLVEGVNGISVPPGDPEALRAAIKHLLEHPDVAEQMGIQGRRWAEEVFAFDHFVGSIKQIVEDVVADNRTHIPVIAKQLPLPSLVAAEQGKVSEYASQN